MQRVLYFDISAIIIMVILLFSIFFHKMTKGITNRAFILEVLSCLAVAAFDIACELCGTCLLPTPGNILLREIMTYGYFIFRPLTAAIYVVYLISYTDTWHKVKKDLGLFLLLITPYAIVIGSLIYNVFTQKVFFIDEQLRYVRGEYIFIIYVCASFYLAFGLYYLAKNRAAFTREKWFGSFSMFPLTIIAIMIQMLYSNLLVEVFATVVSILFLIITVQRPDENVNPVVGIRNYQAYTNDLKRCFYNEKPIDIISIYVLNYNSIISALGEETSIKIIRMSVSMFDEIFKRHDVKADLYYLDQGRFSIVLSMGECVKTQELAEDISKILKKGITILDFDLLLVAQICVIHCPKDVKDFEAFTVLDNVLKKQTVCEESLLYASDIISQSGFEIKSKIDSIINNALTEKKFEMYYQPIYSTTEHRFNSAEALIRLFDEKYGFIPPDVFIPAAEQSGAIHQIGDFIFKEICKFIKSEEFSDLGLDYIEINLSVAQCMQTNLAKKLLAIMRKYDVPPEKINFEITETAVENSLDIMVENLNLLSKEGITFSLDDYGTGYSNIKRIITLPLSIAKLDKSFIDEIHDPDHQVIVTNTVKMLKELNLKIVSEGVETESQLQFLNELGCDYIQGYYFSKPLPEEEFVSFIKEHNTKATV